jgi:hypothetical protein
VAATAATTVVHVAAVVGTERLPTRGTTIKTGENGDEKNVTDSRYFSVKTGEVLRRSARQCSNLSYTALEAQQTMANTKFDGYSKLFTVKPSQIAEKGLFARKTVPTGYVIYHLQSTPDSSTLLAGTSKGLVVVLTTEGVLKAEPVQLEGGIRQLQSTPDSSTLLAGTDSGLVAVLTTEGVLKAEPVQLEGGIRQLQSRLRVRMEIMGPGKYENVRESQSVLIIINPMIFTRTRRPASEWSRTGSGR